jgi:DNA invertase Pin-like site-specific DNA recombinase
MARVLRAIRLSVYREEDPTTSPERQREAINRNAEADGDTIIGEALDLDESAYRKSPFARPDLGDWLHYRMGEFDKVSWSAPDRAIRRMADMSDLARWAKEHKKILHFCNSPAGKIDLDFTRDDPMTMLMLQIIAFAAEMETWNITQRALGSRAYLRQVGRYAGGWTPFGYRVRESENGKGYELEPDPLYAGHLHRMVDDLLSGTKGPTAIATWLNAEGIPTSKDIVRIRAGKPVKGHRWTYMSVIQVLRSRAMCGITEIFPDWRNDTRAGRAEVVYGADGMPVLFAEPIVSYVDWMRVQARLDELSVPVKRPRQDSPWLTGVSLCKACGKPLYSNRQTVKGKTYSYMRCLGVREGTCHMRQITVGSLTAAVNEWVSKNWTRIPYFKVTTSEGDDHAEEIRSVADSIRELAGRIELADADGKPTDDDRAKLEVAKARLRALRTMTTEAAEKENRIGYELTGLSQAEHWVSLDDAGRRAFLMSTNSRIRAQGGRPVPEVDIVPGTFEQGHGWRSAIPGRRLSEG